MEIRLSGVLSTSMCLPLAMVMASGAAAAEASRPGRDRHFDAKAVGKEDFHGLPIGSGACGIGAGCGEDDGIPAAPRAPAPAVRNSSMTEGGEKPAGWENEWTASGKIAVARDADIFRSPPAALHVASIGGPARGQAQQFVEAPAGARFHVKGWVRAEGKASAVLGIQSYTADWKGIEFRAIGNALAGLDWREASGDATLPAGTARFGIVLLLDGEGQAWLDDVEIGPALGPEEPPAEKKAGAHVEPPPKAPNAWTAAEGFYPDFPHAWRQIHEGFVERSRKGGIEVLCIGDSLTQGWDPRIWKERYEPLGAANYGVGGDGTPQVLWRIEHGEIDGLRPKLVVLMIGINNTWPRFGAEDTAKGIGAVVARIREKLPAAKVLLLGVLPIFDKDDGIRRTIREINERIAKLDEGRNVRFLDFGSNFVDAEGNRLPGLYGPDRLHITSEGYRVWADAMDPSIREMLSPSGAHLHGAPGPAASPAPQFPLKVGDDRRHLVDQRGAAFLYQADTPWMLFLKLTEEEACEYLAMRKAQGFTALQVQLTGFLGATDRAGELPFAGIPPVQDFSRPNERFFAHVDRVIAEADRLGLLLAIAPAWSGCCGEGWAGKGKDGSPKPLNANGPEATREFGRWLGRRYGKFESVMWILGGDNDPDAARDEIRALGRGLKDGAPRQLITFHAASSHSSTDVWPPDEDWLDVSMVYTYFRGFNKAWNKNQPDVYEVSHAEHAKRPVRPFFLGESTYEGEHGAWGSAPQARKQAYWCLLAGGFGHAYGSPNWNFPPNWRELIELPGAASLRHLRTLFDSRPWWTLEPDVKNAVAVDGRGPWGANDSTITALAADGSFAIAYLPVKRTITMDLGKISGERVAASWCDPRDGKTTAAGRFAEKRPQRFEPPGDGDWVLVLDGSGR